jgi:hypothetical protein
MADERIKVRYAKLSSLEQWDRNPKLHADDRIAASIRRHGFRDPVAWDPALNEGRGGIVEGNGRVTVLHQMKAAGETAPRGIAVDPNGDWLVPVLYGVSAETLAQAQSYAIDHNALVLAGGNLALEDTLQVWNEEALLALLRDAPDTAELLVSFDSDALDALLSGPAFEAVGAEDQPRLDEKATITCPECGNEFRR